MTVTDEAPRSAPEPGAGAGAAESPAADRPVLEVRNLGVSFDSDEGEVVAVDRVDFRVRTGQTLGIVGESGSGKSVSTKAIMQLLPKNATIRPGSAIHLRRKDGTIIDVAALRPNARTVRRIRGGEVAMIFQEPMASFSPVYTVGNQVTEAIGLHRPVGRAEGTAIAEAMLQKVGIANPALCLQQYPHELSGGMRQRAMIAMALATEPGLLIADEPTTALDVTIQAQILALMRSLQQELQMSVIFITHDMGVIAQIAEEVAIVYLGRVMEYGPTREVIASPQHPYTQGLLEAIPSMDRLEHRLRPIPGDIPSPLARPAGCPFHTRCPKRIPGRCDREAPGVYRPGPDRTVSCFLCEDMGAAEGCAAPGGLLNAAGRPSDDTA